MRRLILLLAGSWLAVSSAAEGPNDWENHQVFGINKLDPHATLFPYGNGSWHQNCGVQLGEYQKHRLLDVDAQFRHDPFWSFFNFDRRLKKHISGYNRSVMVNPKTTTAKTAGDV